MSNLSALLPLAKKTRIYSLKEIKSALIISGIEPNPGPNDNEIDNVEIITINCNGLTNDVRLSISLSSCLNWELI